MLETLLNVNINEYTIIFFLLCCLSIIVLYVYIEINKHKFWKYYKNHTINNRKIFQILFPKDNKYGNLAYSRFLNSLHNLNSNKPNESKPVFAFEIYSNSENTIFAIVLSEKHYEFILGQLYAEFPDIQVKEISDPLHKFENKFTFFSLAKKNAFHKSLNTSEILGQATIGSIIATLNNLNKNEQTCLQIVLSPSNLKPPQNEAKTETNTTTEKTDEQQTQGNNSTNITEKEYKVNTKYFSTNIRIVAISQDKDREKSIYSNIIQAFKQFSNSNNSLVPKAFKTKVGFLKRLIFSLPSIAVYPKPFLKAKTILKNRLIENIKSENYAFSIEEISSIFYFPNESVSNPKIEWLRSRKIPFPLNLPFYNPQNKNDIPRIFAMTDYRGIHKIFGIKKADRRRHFYLLGKSGTGKSTLLKNLIMGDIYYGEGVGVLDPHGDLVEEILDMIPPHREKDVILLDPSDQEYPVGLNMLDVKEDETRELLADGIVSVFKKFFSDSWGPRLQYILTNTILTLLYCQNVSLLAVPRLLMDKNYRKFLLKQVKDSFLLKYWNEEYESIGQTPKLLNDAISPILNKVGRFLSSSMIRNMIGQVKSTIDLSEAMNTGKILLINLSQGKIGEENSSLLGGMLITRLYSNAMQRAKIEESKRRDFYLYVDEFQNFASDSFLKILSEARKYGLALTVTHQYIDQIDESIRNAIFGNVGTMLNYVVGNKDAEVLAKEYEPYLTANDLVNLDRYHLALKMTIDGQQSKPFTAIALKPFYKKIGRADYIKILSRRKYAKSRLEIEFKLNKWANSEYDKQGNLVQPNASIQNTTNSKNEQESKLDKESQNTQAKASKLKTTKTQNISENATKNNQDKADKTPPQRPQNKVSYKSRIKN